MTILGKATFLNGLRPIPSIHNSVDWVLFRSNVPFKQVAGHSSAYHHVRIMRIEDGLRHFILAVQGELWPTLHAQTEYVYSPIRRVQIPFSTLAVAREQQL